MPSRNEHRHEGAINMPETASRTVRVIIMPATEETVYNSVNVPYSEKSVKRNGQPAAVSPVFDVGISF